MDPHNDCERLDEHLTYGGKGYRQYECGDEWWEEDE